VCAVRYIPVLENRVPPCEYQLMPFRKKSLKKERKMRNKTGERRKMQEN
jgi:hypothetical protein